MIFRSATLVSLVIWSRRIVRRTAVPIRRSRRASSDVSTTRTSSTDSMMSPTRMSASAAGLPRSHNPTLRLPKARPGDHANGAGIPRGAYFGFLAESGVTVRFRKWAIVPGPIQSATAPFADAPDSTSLTTSVGCSCP